MSIFIALNARFKAALQTQSLSTFKDKVDRVIRYPQKQTCTEKEFEVKKKNFLNFQLRFVVPQCFNNIIDNQV